jgi:sugar lactone lactonase YvrE
MRKDAPPQPTNRARHRRRLTLAIAAASVFVMLALTPMASAADRIYWSNFFGGSNDLGSISWANLDGSGGGNLNTSGAPMDGPMGIAINSAAGRLYWTNFGNDQDGSGAGGNGTAISYANLDGSGGGQIPVSAPIHGPHGLAFDPATNKLYWPNVTTTPQSIAFSNLDGTNPGVLNTTGATVNGPRSLSLDVDKGRIYWANHDANVISYARLDGSGGADLAVPGMTLDEPEGLALDPVAGRMYFGNFAEPSDPNPAKISYFQIDGSGGNILNTSPIAPVEPHGVALDRSAGRLYWSDYDAFKIQSASTAGGSAGDLSTGAAEVDTPDMPVLQKAPVASQGSIQGAPKPGSKLNCPVKWSPDQLYALLYQAPTSQSFQWLKNGHPIAGETSDTYKAHSVAEYSCLASAQNAAGSTQKSSDAIGVFKVGKLTRDLPKGTAKLSVKLPAAGTVSVAGKKVVKERAAASAASSALARKVKGHHTKLVIKPKGKAKRHLAKTGKVKVKVQITYRPSGGLKGTQTRALVLKED